MPAWQRPRSKCAPLSDGQVAEITHYLDKYYGKKPLSTDQ